MENELEETLHAYLEAHPNPDYDVLCAWIEKYPQYIQELTDFTVSRNLLNILPESAVTPQEQNELRVFGIQLVKRIFQKQ